MSDQCATNLIFNKELQKLKEKVIPHAVEQWESLNNHEQKEISKVFNFFCKMHILVNFASEAEKCIQQLESTVIADGFNPYAKK